MEVSLPVKTTMNSQYRIRTQNLSYKLENREISRYILKNVSCEAKEGEITAIVGPSGAGKTTLLEILSGRIIGIGGRGRGRGGHVLVNEKQMNAPHFRRVSGYVTQDDEKSLFPLLTVEETLMYSARLRLHRGGRGLDNKAESRVSELLIELGLDHISSERTRVISGGEKRRLSIAVELVHNPAVLLIDEPTSGLDSASAHKVASILRWMAKNQGKTIILTIHQPGFRILELFDQFVLLYNGIVLHNGSLNLLEERLKLAGHYSIPRQVNVLEFAIDVTETLFLLVDTHFIIKDDTANSRLELEEEKEDNWKMKLYANSRFDEVIILSQRFSRNIFRTKQLFAARILQALVVGFVLGTIFMNANKKFKLQTQIGFFAFSLTFLLSSTTEALPIFLQERTILMREISRGAYRVSSYVIANALVFVPFLLTVALLYTIPVYWLVGLRRVWGIFDGFLYFSLVVWLVLLMSNSFVACFSALVPDFIMGSSLIAGLMGAFFLFSGYFISKQDIPRYWIFMHYLSLFKYPFECFVINEYGGEEGKRRCLETVEDTCILYGDEFLVHQGLNESQKWRNLVVMLGFIIGYRFLCFIILWYRSHRMCK